MAAVDRPLTWSTPFSRQRKLDDAALLPAEVIDKAHLAIRGALAKKTRGTYGAGLIRFTQFCDKYDISEAARMPASYTLLCAFIGEYMGSIAGGTVKGWMSGIKAFHNINAAPWYGDHCWVEMARVTAYKEGQNHKRPLRAPITTQHLRALRARLDLKSSFHAAVWAAALVAFWGCRRSGEILVVNGNDFSPLTHITRSADVNFLILVDGTQTVSFHLP